jgi:hypothetical protein
MPHLLKTLPKSNRSSCRSPLPVSSGAPAEVKHQLHSNNTHYYHDERKTQSNEDRDSKGSSKDRSNAKILDERRRREEKIMQLKASSTHQGSQIWSDTPGVIQAKCRSNDYGIPSNHEASKQEAACRERNVQCILGTEQGMIPQNCDKPTNISASKMAQGASNPHTQSCRSSNTTSTSPPSHYRTIDPPSSLYGSNSHTLPLKLHAHSSLGTFISHYLSPLPFMPTNGDALQQNSKRTPVKKGLTEDQRLERKKRDDEKALQKKRQQLVEERPDQRISRWMEEL